MSLQPSETTQTSCKYVLSYFEENRQQLHDPYDIEVVANLAVYPNSRVVQVYDLYVDVHMFKPCLLQLVQDQLMIAANGDYNPGYMTSMSL
jgi:hypothetical protein